MPASIVKNRKTLAVTPLRRDALAILEAGIRAVDSGLALRRAVRRDGDVLRAGGKRFRLDRYRHVYVIGIGKAAARSALALERILGPHLTGGIALDVQHVRTRRIKSIAGSHPFPSLPNMQATGEIMGLLKHVDSRDLVIVVVSGGGSALLCWPHKLKCDDISALTRALMAKGATIQELNTVRKHLSEIQGGQLARLAHPATVLGLVFSDVPGDDLPIVASGPTYLDTTTAADARRILTKYHTLRTCRLPHCEVIETPKDPLFFRRVTNVLVASNALAAAAMRHEARRRGYRARVFSTALTGEARDVGRLLADLPRPGEALIAAGETTVTLRGKGRGGRNQEAALGALASLPDDGLVLACASDGIDNGPHAGAIADAVTRAHAARGRLSPAAFLVRNDSFAFFEKTGDAILTGVTGVNVSDLFLSLRRAPPRRT
ncbi:DUF4147 domain-containing protein [Patescibacteria group bacterium]|nr:MAG: DUF4147 domain-containing protein [Patescibacteria group bacterium]